MMEKLTNFGQGLVKEEVGGPEKRENHHDS